MKTTQFDWAEELNKTVVKSLATSFGLDFLLFKDKVGGEVDTIHNVRQGIYATEKERQNYEQREKYDSHHYHTHENYIKTNKEGKRTHIEGTLVDSYTGEVFTSEGKKNLDHIIAAHEIHNDAGRILAKCDGSDLANDSSNLTFTNESINKAKKAKSMDAFIIDLQGQYQETTQEIAKLRNKPALSEQEKKTLKKLENKAAADFERMKDADATAREKYNDTINKQYYSGSQFAFNTFNTAMSSGLQMGTRQMLGVILAETWFAFSGSLKVICEKHRNNFVAKEFLSDIIAGLKDTWKQVSAKYKTFLSTFKDGVIGGVLASVTTTLFNIFFTTERMMIRLIREMWGSLVQVFKLVVFNPDKLSLSEMAKAVSRVLSSGIALAIGVIINEALVSVFAFPFGFHLASFCSALVTGILTMVMGYFLEHSSVMKKFWAFLDKFDNKQNETLEYFRRVNAALDEYIVKITQLEFGVDTLALSDFNQKLEATNCEIKRGLLLNAEVEKRNIKLPYEGGNNASVKSWLSKL